MGHFLVEGSKGRALLWALKKLPGEMCTISEKEYHFFDKWVGLLWECWQAGEPAISYLAAEYCRNVPSWDYLSTEWPDEIECGPHSAERLYQGAVEAGSGLAKLWLAYCYEEGRCGLERRPDEASRLMESVSGTVDSLFMPELYFLYAELGNLYGEVEKAFYECLDHGGEPQPDPGYYELNDRSIELYSDMVFLGLRNVPRHERTSPSDYYSLSSSEWSRELDAVNFQKSREKNKWEEWCLQHGYITINRT